jgi:hypothetical protein
MSFTMKRPIERGIGSQAMQRRRKFGIASEIRQALRRLCKRNLSEVFGVLRSDHSTQ